MKWKSTRRKVQRRLDNLEERREETVEHRDREHKLLVSVDLSRLPGTEPAPEYVADAPTIHITDDPEEGRRAVEGARVIGMDPDLGETKVDHAG